MGIRVLFCSFNFWIKVISIEENYIFIRSLVLLEFHLCCNFVANILINRPVELLYYSSFSCWLDSLKIFEKFIWELSEPNFKIPAPSFGLICFSFFLNIFKQPNPALIQCTHCPTWPENPWLFLYPQTTAVTHQHLPFFDVDDSDLKAGFVALPIATSSFVCGNHPCYFRGIFELLILNFIYLKKIWIVWRNIKLFTLVLFTLLLLLEFIEHIELNLEGSLRCTFGSILYILLQFPNCLAIYFFLFFLICNVLSSGTDILPWAYLFLDGCFVRLGELKHLKNKLNSMSFLRWHSKWKGKKIKDKRY